MGLGVVVLVVVVLVVILGVLGVVLLVVPWALKGLLFGVVVARRIYIF